MVRASFFLFFSFSCTAGRSSSGNRLENQTPNRACSVFPEQSSLFSIVISSLCCRANESSQSNAEPDSQRLPQQQQPRSPWTPWPLRQSGTPWRTRTNGTERLPWKSRSTWPNGRERYWMPAEQAQLFLSKVCWRRTFRSRPVVDQWGIVRSVMVLSVKLDMSFCLKYQCSMKFSSFSSPLSLLLVCVVLHLLVFFRMSPIIFCGSGRLAFFFLSSCQQRFILWHKRHS